MTAWVRWPFSASRNTNNFLLWHAFAVFEIWVPELNKFVRIKLSCRALKTINKNGAFVTLKKAGIV